MGTVVGLDFIDVAGKSLSPGKVALVAEIEGLEAETSRAGGAAKLSKAWSLTKEALAA